MHHEKIRLPQKEADGYVIPMGPFNVVSINTDVGMVGCGAFDVRALDRFAYPAARVTGVATLDDLLQGRVKEANEHARKLGIEAGMTGREALERL
jgi:uncharacterized protein YunC (DUF1805 family)